MEHKREEATDQNSECVCGAGEAARSVYTRSCTRTHAHSTRSAAERGVPVVLDCVVSSSRQALADGCPPVAQLYLAGHDLERAGGTQKRVAGVSGGTWGLRRRAQETAFREPEIELLTVQAERTRASSSAVKGSCFSSGFSWLNHLAVWWRSQGRGAWGEKAAESAVARAATTNFLGTRPRFHACEFAGRRREPPACGFWTHRRRQLLPLRRGDPPKALGVSVVYVSPSAVKGRHTPSRVHTHLRDERPVLGPT
jgi:hypothetical protein